MFPLSSAPKRFQFFTITHFASMAALFGSLGLNVACGSASANNSSILAKNTPLPTTPSISTQILPPATVGSPYSSLLVAAGGVSPYQWSLVAGTLPPGIQLQASGVITGTATISGLYPFTAMVTDSSGQSAKLALTLTVSSILLIANSALAEVDAGAPYTAIVSATGGVSPYQWSLVAGTLPPGIQLQASGVITGTATLSGPYAFTVQVSDSSGQSARLPFTLKVSAMLVIANPALPEDDADVPYTAILSATGGVSPYQWSLAAGTLPPGIQLQASGVITGTATVPGPYPFTAMVTDSYGQSATLAFTLTVLPPMVALPEIWVNNHEGDDLFTYELALPSTWVMGPPPGCTFHAPYWVIPASAGLQSAINDIEACRTATGVGIKVDIPPALYTSTNGLVISQSSNSVATNFLILTSTQDSNLPDGRVVCAHGVQDNVPTSTDIGLDNPDCQGDALTYQLGQTTTAVPDGAFTLSDGIVINTSDYNDVQNMWTAECSGSNCSALTFCNASETSTSPTCASNIGPDHWLIEDMEARMSAGNSGDSNVVSMTAGGTGVPTIMSQYPTHIHFRKIWQHGDWTTLAAGANKVSAGIQFSCADCSLMDSQFSQDLRPGAEGHIALTQGPGPYKINHNWLEGQSSSIFPGGFSRTPNIAAFVPFQDVELRRNRFTFPYAWLGQMSIPTGNTHWSGQSIVRKNCMEYKEGERILRDGNICENVDNSGGQNGTITVINIRQTSGTGADGTNYQATINDLTMTNEIDRNACEGIEIAGRSASSPGNGGGVSYPIKRILIGNVLQYNISKPNNPGCGGNTFGMQITSPGQTWKGTVTENSAGTQATFTITCSVDGGDCPAGPPSVGFQQTDATAGDPILVTGCTAVTAFNMPTHTVGGETVAASVGPPAASGTDPLGLSVTYPWTATANTTDASGDCVLANVEGSPQDLQIVHHTLITDAIEAIGEGPSTTSGPAYIVNHLFTNSIFTNGGGTSSGWYNTIVGEGTPTEEFDYDVSTMTASYLVWPGRTASKYTEYGNNPSYPDSAGCTGSGCNPPVTMYFPATSYCTGAASTSSCVGFIGAMSASSLPLALADYHGYGLRSDSSFYAGNAGHASDGASMGANMEAIDAAQTVTKYVCKSSCGTGPYPD